MPSHFFNFKQFSIKQASSAMKVGTDSVILGSAFPVTGNERFVLDIGTGTGLLALMAAQKCPAAQVDAIEIEEAAAEEAKENFVNSPWANRINLQHNALQEAKLLSSHYDLIISNPPYFEEGASYKINELARSKARSTESLSHQDLLEGVAFTLSEKGYFVTVLPAENQNRFMELAANCKLFLFWKLEVSMTPNAQVSRVVLGFSKEVRSLTTQCLRVYDQGRTRSEAYSELTKDFYL